MNKKSPLFLSTLVAGAIYLAFVSFFFWLDKPSSISWVEIVRYERLWLALTPLTVILILSLLTHTIFTNSMIFNSFVRTIQLGFNSIVILAFVALGTYSAYSFILSEPSANKGKVKSVIVRMNTQPPKEKHITN